MKIELVDVGSLHGYERNAREHSDKQIAQIAASIQQFGFTNPILVNGDLMVIAGHGRLAAAKLAGIQTVPVIRLLHLSEAQQRALILADNKIAQNSTWNAEMLRAKVQALSSIEFDIAGLGFDAGEIADLLAEVESGLEEVEEIDNADFIPDVEAISISRPGDVWKLGKHRLICGSATSADDIARLVEGLGPIDCVWTDPPYNVNYEGSAGKIMNDSMSSSAFLDFLTSAYAVMFGVMREGAPIYVAHADTEGFAFRKAFKAAGFKLSGCLQWIKPSLVLGRSDYQWRHEPILYGWKPGAAHSWFGGRAQTTVIDHSGTGIRVLSDGSIQLDIGDQVIVITGEKLNMKTLDSSVIRHDKPARSSLHPTMKPVSLIAKFLANSTRKGAVVFDPFGGSGSTLIACEGMGRTACLSEIDPKFCDVIVRRWQELTGGVALREDGLSFSEIKAAAPELAAETV